MLITQRNLYRTSLRISRTISTYEFETTSQLLPVNGSNSSFQLALKDDWSVGAAVNGGYLMSVAVKAAQKCLPDLDPLSITGYYMNKGLINTDATVNVQILSKSKSTATAQVTIIQSDLLRTQYLGVFGSLKDMRGISHSKMQPPNLPPIEQCISGTDILKSAKQEGFTIVDRVEFRLSEDSPYAKGFLSGNIVQDASLDCWISFADGCVPDLRSLSLFSDAIPPCAMNHVGTFVWVPTLEYNVHFWSDPQNVVPNKQVGHFQGRHWLRARFYSDHVVNSMLFTDGELWSADGQTLLATSRQLARILTPR